MNVRDDLLQVRSTGVNFHVLRDTNGLYLIDAGFIGGIKQLYRALEKKGWAQEPILGILLTHGHLDHLLNVGKLAKETGAWVAAPGMDASYYSGCSTYRGAARVTGLLESLGRTLFDFVPFAPSRFLEEGDFLNIWHGLTVIHFPGHTAGHSGFYCQSLQLLFCGDLFASYKSWSHLPPSIFNTSKPELLKSISKALDLNLCGIIPNHGDCASPAIHLERLKKLSRKVNA